MPAQGETVQGWAALEEVLMESLIFLPTETCRAVGHCPGAGVATLTPCHLATDCSYPVPGPLLPGPIYQSPELTCTSLLC